MAGRRFAVVLTGITAALLVAAGGYASRVGATGDTLLSSLELPVTILNELGGKLYHGFKSASDSVRIIALLASLAWLVRPGTRAGGDASRLMVALIVAWIAQSFAMDGRMQVGLGLYGVALVIYLWRREPFVDSPPMLPTGVEFAAFAVFMVFFTLSALYRLDVMPEIYLDEVSYYAASRMQLGELPHGKTWVYTLDRFQAQPIPFWLFTGFVKLMPPGVLAIRFAAMASCALSLLIATVALRRRLGSMTTLSMVALCSVSPMYLAFTRVGFYLAVSILHSTLCVAALLWFHDRRDRTSAVVLGALVGASVFAYQVSWFVPALVALTFLVSPREWFQRDAGRPLAVAFMVAVAVVAVGLTSYKTGMQTISDQTFNKGYWGWEEISNADNSFVQVLAPEFLTAEEVSQFVENFEGDGVTVHSTVSRTQRTVLRVNGPNPAIREIRRSFDGADWEILMDSTVVPSVWSNARDLFARAFYAPRTQNLTRFSDEAILAPLCAALLVLGIAEALRRRRLASMRILLVWVIGGVLLPSMVAGAYPRRMLLALPFMQALMALPILEIQKSTGNWGARARRTGWLVLFALYAIAAAMGGHLYARHWEMDISSHEEPGTKAELINLIKKLPEDETLLLWPFHAKFTQLLAMVADEPPPASAQRVFVVGRVKRDSSAIREVSCERELPLSWVVPATEELNSEFELLRRDFRLSTSREGVYSVIRLEEKKPDACRLPSE